MNKRFSGVLWVCTMHLTCVEADGGSEIKLTFLLSRGLLLRLSSVNHVIIEL